MNRHTHYLKKTLDTGRIDRVEFQSAHYDEAGVPRSTLAGMPLLEAYQLVNKWNKAQTNQRIVYALE